MNTNYIPCTENGEQITSALGEEHNCEVTDLDHDKCGYAVVHKYSDKIQSRKMDCLFSSRPTQPCDDNDATYDHLQWNETTESTRKDNLYDSFEADAIYATSTHSKQPERESNYDRL